MREKVEEILNDILLKYKMYEDEDNYIYIVDGIIERYARVRMPARVIIKGNKSTVYVRKEW